MGNGLAHVSSPKMSLLMGGQIWTPSGVVSGTKVRALVLGRFSQKKLKIELKDNAKNE